MATTRTVKIVWKADASGALSVNQVVSTSVTRVTSAANASNSAFAKLRSTLQGYTRDVRNLFTAYLSLQAVQSLGRFVDEYTNLNGRLQVVLGSTRAYAVAQKDVYAIAQATYSTLSTTANLYARLTVALESLNSSQSEVAAITKTVNQALLVSGATATEADSAILQLSQAFASGVLRGEEFNAVNEAGPRIMSALAKSLNVSRGALREMASEGKLTADVLRKALLDDAANIATEAERVPLTLSRGYTSLRNDLQVFIGTMDQTYGVSRKLAEGMVALGRNLNLISGYMKSLLQAAVAAAGTAGLVKLLGVLSKYPSILAALRAGLTAVMALLVASPATLAAVAAALVLMAGKWLYASGAIGKARDALERYEDLKSVSPNDAGKIIVDQYNILSNKIVETEAQLVKLREEMSRGSPGAAIAVVALTGHLEELKEKLAETDAKFDEQATTVSRVPKALGATSDAVQRYANSQRQANELAIASGTTYGRQIKAALEFQATMKSAQELLAREPRLQETVNRIREEAVKTYAKELSQANKANAIRGKSRTAILGEETAKDRLLRITEQYASAVEASGSVEEKAARAKARFKAVQDEVNATVRKYPELADLGAQATKAIAAALEEAVDPARRFKENVEQLIQTLSQGNVDDFNQNLNDLEIAMEEAFNAGDTARVKLLQKTIENLEIASGKAASAADVLRDSNQRMADAARQQAEDLESFFGDAMRSISESFTETLLRNGLNWKSFGKTLVEESKRFVANIISRFAQLNIINPILNRAFQGVPGRTALPTGGSVLGGSGTSGAGGIFGGATGGILGGLGAVFGGTATGFGTGLLASGSIFSGAGLLGGITGSLSAGFASIAGGSIMQGVGLLLGPIGIIAGSIAALVSVFKKNKPPDFRLGGSSANVRSVEGSFSTVFGTVRAGSRQLSYESLIEPIQQFDQGIQQLVQTMGLGQPQIDAIRTALANWSVDLRGSAATAENVLGSRFNAVLTTFSTDVQNFVGSAGTLEERVARLGDALTIESLTKGPDAITTSFEELRTLLEENRVSGEALTDVYSRLSTGGALVGEVMRTLGANFAGTRLELVQFSAELIAAAGGLDNFTTLFQGAMDALFSEEEQARLALDQATTNLGASLGEVGLSLQDGVTSIRSSLRQRLTDALSAGNTEEVTRLLRAGFALNAYLAAQDRLNGLLQETSTAVDTVSGSVEQMNAAFEASALSVDNSMNEYRAFFDQFRGTSVSGLSDFNAQMEEINNWTRESVSRANELARAAGLQRAAEEDLVLIHEEAARRGAVAIEALSTATRGLIQQLGYNQRRNPLIFEAGPAFPKDPERFSLASQVAANLRQLNEVMQTGFLELLNSNGLPLREFLRDLGVGTESLDVAESFDALVAAARSLGVEISDITGSLGYASGDLADANSSLNNAFERALTRLPTAVSTSLRGLLTSVEQANGPEAQATARRNLLDFLSQQPASIRAALAPFLDELDVSSYEEQALTAAEQTNRYLTVANDYLLRIARNTDKPPTPIQVVGQKSQQQTNVEAELLAAVRELTSLVRALNIRSVRGT